MDIENQKREKEEAVEQLNEKSLNWQREKEKLLREHMQDIQLRDDQIHLLTKQRDERTRDLENLRQETSAKLHEREALIRELQSDMQRMKIEHRNREDWYEEQNSKLRNDFESRIIDYEDTLNKKTEENKSLLLNNSSLTQKVQSLD